MALVLMAVVAAAAPTASALKWEPGHLLTNYVDSSGSDYIRVSSTRISSFAPIVHCPAVCGQGSAVLTIA